VELGAEFVHGGNAALRRILKRGGIATRGVTAAMWWKDDGELRAMPDFWERVRRVVDLIPANRPRWSFQDFVRAYERKLSLEDRRIVSWYVGSFEAAPVAALNAVGLRPGHAGADSDDLKFTGRASAIPEWLLRHTPPARRELLLRTEATIVRWRRGRVEVGVRSAEDGRLRWLTARAAVITLPLGVLRARAVRFVPVLAAKQAVIARLGWGRVVRTNFLLAPDFWRGGLLPAPLVAGEGRSFGFVNAPALPVPVWWATLAPQPILTGWAGGSAAERLARKSTAEIRAAAMRSLSDLAGTTERELARWVMDFRFHDWTNDPFTRGAYSYLAAGADAGYRQLAMPVGRTLFFAGEATAAEVGTMHGALESGLRAAREILDA
jgi:hypothetical protein